MRISDWSSDVCSSDLLAFYSTFWGGLTLLLVALFAGSLLARWEAPPAEVPAAKCSRGSFPTGKDQSVSPSPACGVKACCLRAIGSRPPERPARCAGPGADRGGAGTGAPEAGPLHPLTG